MVVPNNKTMSEITKQVSLDLIGLDGNAFSLMGAFARRARAEGWTPEEIGQVMSECKSGDYDNLLRTLLKYTKPSDGKSDDDEEEGEE